MRTNGGIGMVGNSKSLFDGYQFAWYGQRALDSVGLDQYLNFRLILCCDFGLDTPSIAYDGDKKVYSIEADTYKRENWTSAHLEHYPKFAEIEEYIRKLASPLYIVAYSATKSLAAFAQLHKSHLRLIMPDYKLKNRLDDKIKFSRIVGELKLPHPRTSITRLSKMRVDQIKREFGIPFVAHLPFGSASSGTFFISSEAKLRGIHSSLGDSRILVSKYVDGISLNINAAVLGDQIAVAFPSVQLVGLPECSNRPESYCGNDHFSAHLLPHWVIEQARDCAVKVGNWLKTSGFTGMFGMDLIADMDKEQVYPIDLNPRFQNSTHLLTQGEILLGRLPLAVLS